MKKLLLVSLCFLMLCITQVFAQNRTVTGTVTAKEDGLPIPGVTVKVKGTSVGTQTNTAGKFTLSVPTGASITFSFIGYETQTVTPTSADIKAVLVLSSKQLGEVVVTGALGIKKADRETGYTSTLITAKEANQTAPIDALNGLTGKVAGLVIQQTDDGINPSLRVNLRGNRSLAGNNQALIVLDGSPVPTSILTSINPDDIESYNVLNGSGAAALYGSQASNGAIVVTTKRGTANAKPVITYENSLTLSQIANFPKFQNGYGQYGGEGNPFVNPLTAQSELVPFENQQYGPAFNGSTVNIGAPIGSPTGQQLTAVYSAQSKNPIEQFFVTGVNEQNSVSFRQGDAANNFGFSARNVNVTGTVPNDKSMTTNARVSGAKTYGIFKIDFTANYTKATIDEHGYEPGLGDFFSQLLQFPADLNIHQFQDVDSPNSPGNPSNYFSAYSWNPYWAIYDSRQNITRDQFQGNLNLTLSPSKWLDISYRVDDNSGTYQRKVNLDNIAWTPYALSNPNAQFGGANEAYYNPVVKGYTSDIIAYGDGSGTIVNTAGTTPNYAGDQGLDRLEGTALLNFHKTFHNNDFKTGLLLGNSIWSESGNYIYDSSGSLLVPGYFNTNTITGTPTLYQANATIRQVAFFADASVSYKDFATIEGTLRNDRDSRLAPAEQSFYYPSVKAVFIPTSAIPGLKNNDVLDYWKIYGDLSRVGNISVSPYNISNTYSVTSGFPYGSNGALSLNTTSYNPGLKPEIISEKEIGTEIGLFKDRLHLTADYYYQKSRNQTLDVSVSPTTGYQNEVLNAGEIDSYGEEFSAQAIIFQKTPTSVGWTVGGNFAINDSKVVSLLPGVDKLLLSTAYNTNGGNVGGVYAVVGQSYPQLYVTDYQRSPTGQVVVNPNNGTPLVNPSPVDEGRTSPKYNLGLNTSVSYKFVTLNVVAEYRAGNVLYSQTGSIMDFAGSSAVSASAGRQIFIYPNSVINTGTTAAPVYTPNTTVPVYKGGWEYWSTYPVNVGSPYVSSAAFWRIREVSLSFNLNQFIKNTKFIKGLTVALTGRNLFLFLPKSNQWGDPELSDAGSTGNGVGTTSTSQLPTPRVYGANLQVTF
ncbi:SusC/RagA family TonB-linked outer membrane protein [Mucilaginibacter sp. X4EP1]|uniref:SusC/RagA family TonB-linked outer membrane protein n=1 Tax=Mucilaginibacter sp. X4EP1 TaxID=2723092 RepID=UPI00216A94AE|nr:SusC/RagA family TonB-linked outer membrane protein [Mucilaginibacter sp. X4EP1]MCS3814530.1 TonB-linked SusC/RagA family outer membrane protein [Mucilaginibacter sp. X4EP1]